MQDEPWYVQRRRELEAAAPVKRKKSAPAADDDFDEVADILKRHGIS